MSGERHSVHDGITPSMHSDQDVPLAVSASDSRGDTHGRVGHRSGSRCSPRWCGRGQRLANRQSPRPAAGPYSRFVAGQTPRWQSYAVAPQPRRARCMLMARGVCFRPVVSIASIRGNCTGGQPTSMWLCTFFTAADALRGGGGLQVLRVARTVPLSRQVPVGCS